MSQITDEIMSRKAVLRAEEDAMAAKKELHRTILSGLADPFMELLKELQYAAGWSCEDRYRVTLDTPSNHQLEWWQAMCSGNRQTFEAYFRVNADSSVTVKSGSQLIGVDDLRSKLLDHVAKYYTRREDV